MLLCLCSSFIVVYPYYVNIILLKFPGVLQNPFWKGGYNPLANMCCGIDRVYELDMVKVLVRHGIGVDSVMYNTALAKEKISIADYLIEQGAKFPVEGVTPNHILIRKRRACRDAVMALYGVFLKRCRFNRDVAKNSVKPLVWETRLEPPVGFSKPPP
jgi:hypothetical protein